MKIVEYLNLQQLPRPVEEPKEPKRENFDTDEAFNMVYEQYVYDKKEYDFWVRFEIRDAICVPDDDTVVEVEVELACSTRVL